MTDELIDQLRADNARLTRDLANADKLLALSRDVVTATTKRVDELKAELEIAWEEDPRVEELRAVVAELTTANMQLIQSEVRAQAEVVLWQSRAREEADRLRAYMDRALEINNTLNNEKAALRFQLEWLSVSDEGMPTVAGEYMFRLAHGYAHWSLTVRCGISRWFYQGSNYESPLARHPDAVSYRRVAP